MPNVAAYAPARPLLRRPVGLDVVRRLQRRRADELRHPLEDELAARVEGSSARRTRPARRGGTCTGRRPRPTAASCRRARARTGAARSPRPRARPRARTARHRRRAPSSTLPCELACWSRIRHAGSAGVEANRARRGSAGRRRSAARAVDLTCPRRRPRRRSSDQLIARTGASSTTRSPSSLRQAQRDQLRAADDAVGEALLRREQLVRPARARDHPQPLEERERVRGLRQEAVGEVRAEVLARGLVADLACAATRRT